MEKIREFWRRIADMNKRDAYGLVGWFLAAMLFGVLAWPVMVAREIYQWKHYKLSRFEWEDVARYSAVILLGSLVWWLIMRFHL